MRVLATDVRSWTALAVLSLVVGLIGPFGTFEMSVPARLAYWTAVVLGTAIMGTFCADLFERLIGSRLPLLLRAALAGTLAGPPIVLVVAAINALAFGLWFQPIHLASLTLYCALIAAAVTVLGAVFTSRATPAAAPAAPVLLDRLALPQRGRLLRLAVADHYVEVVTDKGKALLLMRLSDAIRETAPIEGLQVHRSHWVALDAVARSTRQAGRPVLELKDGAIVPISRSYLAAAKAAGLVV